MRLDVLRSATMLDGTRVTAAGDAADLASEVGARRHWWPRPAVVENDTPGLRFAFYGRMSTEDYQDRESSSRWQREAAEETIAGRGVIVAEYFDSGYSRGLSWARRPQATALLCAAAEPDRRFDAVVVGEYERAFYGTQFRSVISTLARHGVQLWLPEAAGPIDLDDPTHQALMLLLGAQSRREVLRARHRTLAAMRAQVVL